MDDERLRRKRIDGETYFAGSDLANALISQRLEELDDPELAMLRTRQAYEQQGYSRRWIDQRMRSVSVRHELAGEWYRRGVRDSEQFRSLTNALMHSAFGMDVEAYRRHKGLFGTRHGLRDHMNDLELALLALAETTAVELHRRRKSNGLDALLLDVKDVGQIVATTRRQLESALGTAIASPANHLPQRGPAPLTPSSNLAA